MERAPEIEFEIHRLENGLEVLLCPNRLVPLVHLSVHYRVGSSYEQPEASGFAHLFEHLMFQGSENLSKNEHGRLIDEAGGRWNATTNKDRTNYYQTLPSHYLDLGLWLEAERMRSLQVTPENFENQRRTVIEEKKQSYDNRPYGKAFLRFDELAYRNWAYAHSTIGEVEDLERAKVEDARRFHRAHYGPDNAVLSLCGDFDPRQAQQRIEHYFGPVTHRTGSQPPRIVEPEQREERVEEMDDPLAVLAAAYLGFHIGDPSSPESYALAMLALILSQGESSRFYRELVHKRNWISSLSAGPNHYRGPQLFKVSFLVQSQADPKEVVRAVSDELERATEEPASDEELEKARNQFTYRFVSRQSKVSGVGEALARYAVYYGDARIANQDLQRYQSVTAQDILRAARKTFGPQNRTLLMVRPAA